jgi:hypothetical protein
VLAPEPERGAAPPDGAEVDDGALNEEPDDLLGAVVDGALPVLVAPELVRFTVVLVPVEIPDLVFERVTLVDLPVDVAPPVVTVDLRLVVPLSVRTVDVAVPFCFTLPVATLDDPRTADPDFVFV